MTSNWKLALTSVRFEIPSTRYSAPFYVPKNLAGANQMNNNGQGQVELIFI